jgi:hypothetical protein
MGTPFTARGTAPHLSRRDALKAGLAAGITLSAWPVYDPTPLWGEEAAPPKRGGILRVRGRDPVHFDPHLTRNARWSTATRSNSSSTSPSSSCSTAISRSHSSTGICSNGTRDMAGR